MVNPWWPWSALKRRKHAHAHAHVHAPSEHAPSDEKMIRSIAKQNAAALRDRYEDQRALAALCKRTFSGGT